MKEFIFGKSLYLLKLRLAWIGLIVFIVIVFLMLKIVPGGDIKYEKDYSRQFHFGQGFIYNLTPQERVDEDSNHLPRIIGDPVYFSVFTPRPFSKAKLKVSYYRSLGQETPIIEAGVLADEVVWRYDLKPIENRLVDNLKSSWNVLSEDPLILQSDNYYQDKSEFLADLGNNSLKACPKNGLLDCLAVYNYDLNVDSKFLFAQREKPLTINIPLRGAHSLFLYTSQSNLSVNIDFVDLNLDKKEDPITLILSQGEKVIATSKLEDENDIQIGLEEIKNLDIFANNISEGVYKLEIKISDDVVIKKIESSTNRLVFSRRLWPVSWNENIEVYTDKNYLFLKALGPASEHDFKFGSENFSLDESYLKKEYNLNNSEEINKIELEKDDIILENSGVFSFSKNNLFNPQIKRIDSYFQPTNNIKYIIANYNSPQKKDGGLLVQTAEFNMTGVYREKGKYNFAFSIPHLEQEENGYLDIEKIEIEFSGRTLWQKLFNL